MVGQSFLYRVGLVLTHKQPYVDWANSFGDGVDLTPELAGRPTMYLVPEPDGEPDLQQMLDEFWEPIFEEELAAWMLDESVWPGPRTREMFSAWFEIEMIDSLFDLTPDEPLTQSEVDAIDLDDAVRHCAWCGAAIDEGAGRFAGFMLADRSRLAHREGLVVPISIDEETVVVGIMPRADSEHAREGEDIVFRLCTSRCERALRSVVPKALRNMFRRQPPGHAN